MVEIFSLCPQEILKRDLIKTAPFMFAERHRFLGRASEAQIESYHYQFKRLFHLHHLNMAHDEPERLRRCLADTTLRAVQPVLPPASLPLIAPQPAIA